LRRIYFKIYSLDPAAAEIRDAKGALGPRIRFHIPGKPPHHFSGIGQKYPHRRWRGINLYLVPYLAARVCYKLNSTTRVLGRRDEDVGLISIGQLFGVGFLSRHAELTMANNGSIFMAISGIVA
jgi:hypothetical protein